MKSLRLIITSLIVLSIIALFIQIRIDEHNIYKKYHMMHGTIIDAYPTSSKHGAGPCMITVKLDDNSTGLINGGYTSWEIGDSFTNKINYNHIVGITGFAYSLPNLNFWMTIVSPIITILIMFTIFYFLCYFFYIIYKKDKSK
jgi:hypothetical protein